MDGTALLDQWVSPLLTKESFFVPQRGWALDYTQNQVVCLLYKRLLHR